MKTIVLLAASLALGNSDVLAAAYTSFQNVSSDEYNALASGCSAATIGRESKAREEAKDSAKAALVDVCKSRYMSSSDCETWCQDNGADELKGVEQHELLQLPVVRPAPVRSGQERPTDLDFASFLAVAMEP